MWKHWFSGLVLGAAVLAQASAEVASVRIDPGHPRGVYTVDGQLYVGPRVMLWPTASKHYLSIQSHSPDFNTQLDCSGGWTTNLGDTSMPVTASSALTSITAQCTVSYALTVSFFDPGDSGVQGPGRVCVNGKCFDRSTKIYLQAGSNVAAQAYPNAGYVFTGWAQLPGLPATNAYIMNFPLNQPHVLQPLFQPARPIKVNIQSDPPGLQVLADRAAVSSGTSLEWGFDTVHTIGVIPTQRDANGQLWLFDSWSDGGAATHEYKMPAGASPVTVTARFVRGTVVTFLTDPPLLKLKIDGRDNWMNYTFEWPAGSKHAVSAPAEQTDAQGRHYRFTHWADGQPATREVTVDSAPGDLRYTATYEPYSRIVLDTEPAGIAITVNGMDCATPCTLNRRIGETLQISAPASIETSDGARLVFDAWSDHGSAERTLTAVAEARTLLASYHQQYRLSASIMPTDGGSLRIEPASADGYYDADTRVSVAVDPAPGYRLEGWDGDAPSVRSSVLLAMSGPRAVRARLDTVPFISTRGVRNAAGETPQESVAAGSIISVLGLNLAPETASSTGPALSQSLAGVTIRVDDRLLPLVMVSPEEVKAQLPSDLSTGEQQLTVQRVSKPSATAKFTVARNAPGLFYSEVEGQATGVFTRMNGDAITRDNPLKAGECLNAYGTGAGPYSRPALFGFAVPLDMDLPLADGVEIVSGDSVWIPDWAGAATGQTGVDMIRFCIPPDILLDVPTLPIKVRVNGVDSNVVLVPVDHEALKTQHDARKPDA